MRATYPDLRYLNFDAVENREAVAAVPTAAWGTRVGDAVLDEAQKAPEVFDKVKYAFDAQDIDFSVLLGSSRFMLLDRVRETLAGRAFVFELAPLMASELRAPHGTKPRRPLLDALLGDGPPMSETLAEHQGALFAEDEARTRDAWDHLATWGGMPGLVPLEDDERREWLRSYQQTFLERDLADLARIADLTPFSKLQTLAMLRTGGLLSYAELGRDAGLSAATARRYLEYLRISHQILLLPPYHKNLTSALVKAPKLYWLDLGMLRHGTRQWGPLSGELFETLVVGEVYKWLTAMRPDAGLSFYRTRSGMEVDLLIETEHGVLGIEIKSGLTVNRRAARGLLALAEQLGDRWLGGVVAYGGATVDVLDDAASVWAVPAYRLV